MFDTAYKTKIPFYVRKLGVVTAQTGAAVRDIINVAKRRNPFIEIVLYPAIVQGDQAVCSIINGIHALEREDVDVMIVGRGGGSIEDLWAFNHREVAQAVFDCSVPIISAVGHETDTTIIDYVADLRAPTPSAAAELAVCDMAAVVQQLYDLSHKVVTAMLQKCKQQRLLTEIWNSGSAVYRRRWYSGSIACAFFPWRNSFPITWNESLQHSSTGWRSAHRVWKHYHRLQS